MYSQTTYNTSYYKAVTSENIVNQIKYSGKLATYYLNGDLDSCAYYNKIYENLAEDNKNNNALIDSYLIYCELYYKENRNRKATTYGLNALKLIEKTDKQKLSRCYKLLISVYTKREKLSEVQKYQEYLDALETDIKTINNYENIISDMNEKIFEYDEKLNKLTFMYNDSLYVLDSLITYQDALILVLEQEKKILKQDKKILQQELEIKNLEIEKQEQKEKFNLVFRRAAITVSIIFIALLIIMYFLLKQRIKTSKELIVANDQKNKFFSILSHDLKNPLRSMNMLSIKLIDKYDKYTDDRKQAMLFMISESTKSLYTLVENLLNWARVQNGKIEPVFKKHDLVIIVNENIQLVQNLADEKKITISHQINISNKCYCDVNMLNTVFRNLLTNAIKFTPNEGKVEVVVKENEKEYIVYIIDNGVGIPEEKAKTLFSLSGVTSSKGTNNEPGSGLGLILCKEFINKHNGDINVDSVIDQGTMFTFNIPKLAP